MNAKSKEELVIGLGLLAAGALGFKFYKRHAQPSDTVPIGSVVTFNNGQTETTSFATNVSALQAAGATQYVTPGIFGYTYLVPVPAIPQFIPGQTV